MPTNDDKCESFNRLLWHDSKLRGLHLLHRNDSDDLVLDIDLRRAAQLELTRMTIVLEDVAFFICDIDVQGKRECSDDISSAKCSAESDLKTRIQKERLPYSLNGLKNYLHFSFYLIPPGGSLDVLAAGFRLVVPETREL